MRLPSVLDAAMVGSYTARAHAGGGMVWDEVLEYRVWTHDPDADDSFTAHADYDEAQRVADELDPREEVVALVLQREYLEESQPGVWEHVRTERLTEWPVEFLARPRRDAHTIPDFLSPDAPPNRLQILRGQAPRAGGKSL